MATTLPPNRLQPAGHYRASYDVILPGSVPIEEALKSEYWAHVGSKLRQHDTINIFPEDGTRFVEAIVLLAGRGFAHLHVIRDVALAAEEDASDPALASLKVKFNGPHDRWTVIRVSDGEKLKTGCLNQAEAQRWVVDHLAAQAR